VLAVTAAPPLDGCEGALRLSWVSATGALARQELVGGGALAEDWDRLWLLGEADAPVVVTTRRAADRTRVAVSRLQTLPAAAGPRAEVVLARGITTADATLLPDGRVLLVGVWLGVPYAATVRVP
jgi:hypothetical protein